MNNRMASLRIKCNLTQKQLAEKVLCSQNYISAIESGDKEPSLQVARRIAKALCTTVDSLFKEMADD